MEIENWKLGDRNRTVEIENIKHLNEKHRNGMFFKLPDTFFFV
jgi:hypothetical protein